MIPAVEVPAAKSTKSVHTADEKDLKNPDDTQSEDTDDEDEDEEEEEDSDGSDDSDAKFLYISQDDSLDCTLDEDDENEDDDPLIELTDIGEPKSVEKSVIVLRDDSGFGIRLKGQAPAVVDQVQESGAAWRAGVRRLDRVSKVNGILVDELDSKEVNALIKSCSRFVGLTLLTSLTDRDESDEESEPKLALKRLPRTRRNLSSASNSLFDRRRNNSIAILPDSQSEQRQIVLATEFSSSSERNALRRKFSNQEIRPNQWGNSFQSSNGSRGSAEGDDKSMHTATARSDSLGTQIESNRVSEDVQNYTCMICRTKLDQRASSGLTPTGRTCSKCQSKTQVRDGPKYQQLSLQRIQRTHQSLRESQAFLSNSQVRRGQADMATGAGRQLFRITQSASTNSLPLDKTSNTMKQNVQPGLSKQPLTVNKRLEIIRELIDTEKTHTDKLRCLDELFYRPLKEGGYMTSEQLRSVFSCHRTLYKIHRQIYRILLSANYGVYSEPLIGSALIEIFEGSLRKRLEKAACSFCSSQATNTELLNKLTRKDSRIGEFLAQVNNQQMIGRLGIKDLLASCFQRLTKYPLLLENLLRATPEKPSDLMQNKIKANQIGYASRISTRLNETTSSDNQNTSEPDCVEEDSDILRMLAMSLVEEREFIERALDQTRQMLFRVNDSIRVSMSRVKLREIWKRTDKYPGVPSVDITNQQVVHEGFLTLRLSKRSFDVYMLLLNDYIIILTRESQDKYRLKSFTPDGKFAVNPQAVYSPVFVIDEHLTTRDAATDENGFYLLCKRKDDSRIYEFASRSPAERLKWRDRIQWTIERRMSKRDRRPSSKLRPHLVDYHLYRVQAR